MAGRSLSMSVMLSINWRLHSLVIQSIKYPLHDQLQLWLLTIPLSPLSLLSTRKDIMPAIINCGNLLKSFQMKYYLCEIKPVNPEMWILSRLFSINWTISITAVFSIDEPQGVEEVLEDDSWKTGLADTFTTLQCHIRGKCNRMLLKLF